MLYSLFFTHLFSRLHTGFLNDFLVYLSHSPKHVHIAMCAPFISIAHSGCGCKAGRPWCSSCSLAKQALVDDNTNVTTHAAPRSVAAILTSMSDLWVAFEGRHTLLLVGLLRSMLLGTVAKLGVFWLKLVSVSTREFCCRVPSCVSCSGVADAFILLCLSRFRHSVSRAIDILR